MKNFLLFASILLITFTTSAQEVIVGGDMEDEESWSSYCADVTDVGYTTFNYKDDKPSDGEAGCLEVYGYGTSGIFIFQEVPIEPGAGYTFDGVIKNISTEPLTSKIVDQGAFQQNTSLNVRLFHKGIYLLKVVAGLTEELIKF